MTESFTANIKLDIGTRAQAIADELRAIAEQRAQLDRREFALRGQLDLLAELNQEAQHAQNPDHIPTSAPAEQQPATGAGSQPHNQRAGHRRRR